MPINPDWLQVNQFLTTTVQKWRSDNPFWWEMSTNLANFTRFLQYFVLFGTVLFRSSNGIMKRLDWNNSIPRFLKMFWEFSFLESSQEKSGIIPKTWKYGNFKKNKNRESNIDVTLDRDTYRVIADTFCTGANDTHLSGYLMCSRRPRKLLCFFFLQ